MSTREKLLNEVERFLLCTGMSPSEFGKRSIGDRMLVAQLRKGRDVVTGTADKIRKFMSENRKGLPVSDELAACL